MLLCGEFAGYIVIGSTCGTYKGLVRSVRQICHKLPTAVDAFGVFSYEIVTALYPPAKLAFGVKLNSNSSIAKNFENG